VATLLLPGAGAAGIQVNEVDIFCAPDIFPAGFFFSGYIAYGIKMIMGYFFHAEKDMGKWR
jgi:hypothetical protein